MSCVDLRCKIDPNAKVLQQIARHVVFGAVPTARLLEANQDRGAANSVSRAQLAVYLLSAITWHNHGCTPSKSDAVCAVLDVFGVCAYQIIATVNAFRAALANLLPGPMIGPGKHAQPFVLVWLRRIPVNPRDIAALRREHMTYNSFLVPTPQRPAADEQRSSEPFVELVCAASGAPQPQALGGNAPVPKRAKTQQAFKPACSPGKVAADLAEEVVRVYRAANVSPVVLDLQIHGFLNPKALPRPTITPARAESWDICFSGVDSPYARNLMAAILSAVAVQFNLFVHAQGNSAHARIGHISKVFKHYTAAHYLAIELFMTRNGVDNRESVHLRYNQLVANFRKFLRAKFNGSEYKVQPPKKGSRKRKAPLAAAKLAMV